MSRTARDATCSAMSRNTPAVAAATARRSAGSSDMPWLRPGRPGALDYTTRDVARDGRRPRILRVRHGRPHHRGGAHFPPGAPHLLRGGRLPLPDRFLRPGPRGAGASSPPRSSSARRRPARASSSSATSAPSSSTSRRGCSCAPAAARSQCSTRPRSSSSSRPARSPCCRSRSRALGAGAGVRRAADRRHRPHGARGDRAEQPAPDAARRRPDGAAAPRARSRTSHSRCRSWRRAPSSRSSCPPSCGRSARWRCPP